MMQLNSHKVLERTRRNDTKSCCICLKPCCSVGGGCIRTQVEKLVWRRCESTELYVRSTQRLQNPLIKEYALNLIRAPLII